MSKLKGLLNALFYRLNCFHELDGTNNGFGFLMRGKYSGGLKKLKMPARNQVPAGIGLLWLNEACLNFR
ncbi:MAG TPA: hypothetical protein VI413_10320 [Paludibacter sp.]